MSALYQVLYGSFVPPPVTAVRRSDPDRILGQNLDPKPRRRLKETDEEARSRQLWFAEYNRQRLKQIAVDNRMRVLAELKRNQGVSARMLVQIMGCSLSMCKCHLKTLIADGDVYAVKRSIPLGGMELIYFTSNN